MHHIAALLRSLFGRAPRCHCGAPAPLATDERRRPLYQLDGTPLPIVVDEGGHPICIRCATQPYTRGA